jgi:hypothetical protein
MRAGALLLIVSASLPVLGLWAVPAGGADEVEGDPLRLRRVLLSPDSLLTQLERARQGVLVKLPLAEFEERVRRARQALRTAPAVPRLIEATYKGSLVEASGKRGVRGHAEPYLTGRGYWTVDHAGPLPGVLPLRPLSLALAKTRFENREALVGDFNGEGPGLLLDKKGRQEVLFEWTARGDEEPDGIHFDLRVPAAPLAMLELELPAGRTISGPESYLVRDAGPAESPARHLWTVYCSQQSVLHLTVNPDPESSPLNPGGMLVVDSVRSQHTLAPEGETSEFTFVLKVTARGVQSLSFACDPPLVPYKVALLPEGPVPLAHWEFEPARKPGGRGTLTLHFREPVHGDVHPRVVCRGTLGRLRIGASKNPSPSAEQRDWFCPGLYVLPGVHPPRTETIDLRCHPQLRLEDWQPGDFHVARAKTEADGTYHLTLAANGVPQQGSGGKSQGSAGGQPSSPIPDSWLLTPEARPRAVLRTHGVDYRASVLTWWQLDGASPVLTAQISYDVRYGRLFELPLQVSPGWDVERVWCSAPTDPLRNWTMNPVPSGALLGGGVLVPTSQAKLLLVELQPPFEPQRSRESGSPTLFVRFRWRGTSLPSPIRRGSKKTWTGLFPVVRPVNASGITGGLAVDWDDEGFEAGFTPSLGSSAEKAPTAGPWDTHTPRAWFPWWGQPAQGTLRLEPRPAVLRTRSLNEVKLSPGRLTVSTQLTLDVESGVVGSVDLCLFSPPPGSPPLTWTTVRNQGSGIRSQGSGIRGQESGVRNRESAGRPSLLTPDSRLLTPGFERLPQAGAATAVSALAAPHVLGGAAFFTPPLAAEHWRLTLAVPLRAQQSLTLRATRDLRWPPERVGIPGNPLARAHRHAFWPVPLITSSGNSPVEGEVRVYAEQSKPPADAIAPVGLRERVGTQGTGTSAGLWRVYTHTSAAVGLSLRALPPSDGSTRASGSGGPLRAVPRSEAVIPRAMLRARVEPHGRLVHTFAFEVLGWPQPTLPLRLPPGARLAAARVDGLEVTSLPLDQELADGTEIALPVPASSSSTPGKLGSHSFEVVYVIERAPCELWARFEAPAPDLPLQPLAFRRVWRLPGSLTPVGQTGLTRLPGPEPPSPLAALTPGQPLPSLSSLLSRSLDRWAARQEQAVRTADARLRQGPEDRQYSLAEALSDLAFEGLASQDERLVLDTAALEESGLSAGTTFRVGKGDESALASLRPLDLVYVPCRPAPLVTTRRQWRAWQQGLGDPAEDDPDLDSLVPESVTAAVATALADGHDLSGRFRTVLDWLNRQESGVRSQEPGVRRQESSGRPSSLTPDSVTWVDWEVTTGGEAEEALWVVRAGVPSAGGFVLAGLLLLWAWGARRTSARPGWKEAPPAEGTSASGSRGRRALFRLLCGIGVSGLAWIWLPAGLHDLSRWPLVASCAIALWWYLTAWRHRRGNRETRSRSTLPRPDAPPPSDGAAEQTAAPSPGPESGGLLGGATAGVLAVLLAAWVTGPAAPPSGTPAAAELPRPAGAGAPSSGSDETIVYLLPGSKDKDPDFVLVSPALLERLARRPAAPASAPVLITADYQGTIKKPGDRKARFEATFQVFCPTAEPATLELPLEGRNLVLEPDVLLDGTSTALTALPPPRLGYSIKVAGKGLKTVRLVFRAAVSGDEVRELLFDIPRVVQARLSLRLPKGSAFPQALVKVGAQRVTEDEAGLLLEADLGAALASEGVLPRSTRESGSAAGGPSVPVHLRWREPRPGEVPRVRFKEAYLWDLGQRGHTLTCVLHYTVDGGAVSRLTVDVPSELLVGRVEARRPAVPDPSPRPAAPTRGADEAAVRLRDWQLEARPVPPPGGRAGPRPLHLDFQAPVSGGIAVLLVLYPREGLFDAVRSTRDSRSRPAMATLPVPQPHGTPLPREGYLAYRLQGLEARSIDNRRVEGILPAEFPLFFWQAAGRGAAPAYTCRIVPEGTARPRLTLEVWPAPPRRQGTLAISWQVGRAQADFRAALDLSAPNGDLTLIEWEIPAGVEVSAVAGPKVHEWSLARRPGGPGRLQVWLRQAVKQTHLEVSGSTSLARLPGADRQGLLAGSALSVALRQALARSALFVLPALRVIGVEQTTLSPRVAVTVHEGMDLVVQSLSGLQVIPENVAGGIMTAFSGLLSQEKSRFLLAVRQEDYGGRFTVVPARLPAVRVVTTVDVRNRQLTFEARVEVLSPGATPKSLELRLGNWRGPAPRREAPGARVLTLSGSMPLEEALTEASARADRGNPGGDGLSVPRVQVLGAGSVESWLVLGEGAAPFRPHVLLAGSALLRPLQPEPLPAGVAGLRNKGWRLDLDGLGSPPGEGRNVRQAVVLVRNEAPGEGPPIRVLLREQVSAAPDGRRWLHETTWWLYHPAPTELVFTLPEGVKILGATLDGREQPFRERRTSNPERPTSNEGASSASRSTPDVRRSTFEVLVSLPGEGARRVSLRWQHQDGTEELSHLGSRPLGPGPRLRGEDDPPATWTLHVPPGLHAGPGAFQAGPLPAARVALRRAETQLRLTKLLLESEDPRFAQKDTPSTEAQLANTQRQFAFCCQAVDELLRGVEHSAERRRGERPGTAAESEELRERLGSLRRENRVLTDHRGRSSLRREAERLASGDGRAEAGTPLEAGALVPAGRAAWDVEGLAGSGRPFYRLSGGTTASASVEVVAPELVTSAGLERRRAVAATALLLCVLFAVWLLSAFPSVVALAQFCWPEQVLLLGLFGLQAFGATWPVVFLLVLGGSARLLALIGGLWGLIQRPRPRQPRLA